VIHQLRERDPAVLEHELADRRQRVRRVRQSHPLELGEVVPSPARRDVLRLLDAVQHVGREERERRAPGLGAVEDVLAESHLRHRVLKLGPESPLHVTKRVHLRGRSCADPHLLSTQAADALVERKQQALGDVEEVPHPGVAAALHGELHTTADAVLPRIRRIAPGLLHAGQCHTVIVELWEADTRTHKACSLPQYAPRRLAAHPQHQGRVQHPEAL